MNNDQQSLPPDDPIPLTANKHPTGTRHKVLTAVSIIAVMLLLGAAYFVGHKSSTNNNVKSTNKSVTKLPSQSDDTESQKFIDNYLDVAAPLTPTPIIFAKNSTIANSCDDGNGKLAACDFKYYKIGTTKDNKNIVLVWNGESSMEAEINIAVGVGNNYTIYGKYRNLGLLTEPYLSEFKKALDPSTSYDATAVLPDVIFDKTLTYKSTEFTAGFSESDMHYGYPLINGDKTLRFSFPRSDNLTTTDLIGHNGPKNLYSVVVQDSANFKLQEVYQTVKRVFAESYQFSSKLKSKGYITWQSTNKISDDEFATRAAGCGSFSGYLVAKNIKQSELTLAGTGANGEQVYTMATISPLYKQIYDEDYASGANLYGDDAASLKNLTAEQFQALHGVFLSKNGLGEYVIYLNQKFLSGGGCGKPVVYLYPTHTQSVSVQVGAQVTKSEPLYGSKGWQNVLAEPSGQLTYNGSKYPNLFWEGTGNGSYPMIDSGTVVPISKAVQTMRQQLMAQGLNATEINDFVDFWQPRLPSTSYVRLAWLSKTQINELAPLDISPRPTTTIRVFLDMQGLNRQIDVAPQHFNSPLRNGFTAVEWGGLVRD